MNKYLRMQNANYNRDASAWSLRNKDAVVAGPGGYDLHNKFADYDEYLFPKIDTSNMVALEYGCGPGRNLIKFNKKFKRIDGVDIAEINLMNARTNLADSGIEDYNLFLTSGDNVPTLNESYDIVFSVICLQHICVHEIRMKIMTDIYRVLKPEGYFCFQMGFGKERLNSVSYYDNFYDSPVTNGLMDTRVEEESYLLKDLESIGYKNVKYEIRPVGPHDLHPNWIWVQAQKV